MKNIKQIREAYDVSTNKTEAEDRKLSSLVEFGLLDANKLPALKESLNKPVDRMTAQDKRMFINLLESMISEVYSKKSIDAKDYFATPDPRVERYGYPSQKEAPSVLMLKRKAIRVFPDGQKVALYYAQSIDKYVSIPYNEIGINEDILGSIGRFVLDTATGGNSSNNSSSSTDSVAKELKPLEREKTRLNVSSDFKGREPYRTAVDARQDKAIRDANYAMTRNVRESFKSNLEALNEGAAPRPPKGYVPPKIRPKAGIGPGGKAAPEKTPWEKLTDVSDDGTLTGMGKDLMPVVGTVRQAKRTSAAYNQAMSDYEKGNYWDATKGAADTALQGGLTAISGIGDVLTATGVAAPVVTGIRGAVSAAKAARTASKVNKFIATSKTVPVKTAPALPAPETVKPQKTAPALPAPETVKPPKTEPGPTANISAEKARKIRNANAADQAITRQTNIAAASSEAEKFRKMYPQTGDTTASPAARDTTKPTTTKVDTKPKQTFEPPSVAVNKGDVIRRATADDRNAGVRVKDKDDTFRLAEPATSKGQLVPVKRVDNVSVSAREPKEFKPPVPTSAREPSDLDYNKSTVGKWPTVQKNIDVDSNVEKKSSTSTQYKKATQDQTQTQTSTKKDQPENKKTRTDKKEPPPKKGKRPGFPFPIPSLGTTDAMPLKALTPSLKLPISGPKREGDADAIRSRMAAYERKAWQAQAATVSESVKIDLDGNEFVLNNKEANKVASLYESLNIKNKKKMIKMMNESEEQLNKIVSFAVRQ